jgi:quinol monooxygenase YgiN
VIIVAGWLRVDAADRDGYLAAVADVARLARAAPGCLDFTQAADPLDAERINVYERWESDEDLLLFRASGCPDEPQPDVPEVLAAKVRKYRISSVEAP